MTTTPATPFAIALTSALAIITAGCASDDGTPAAPAPETTTAEDDVGPSDAATDAPPASDSANDVLDPGDDTHLGLTWFSPPEPGTEEAVFALWEQAVDASSVGRVMVDWIDVEPGRGDRRFDDLDADLAEMVESGRRPMVSVVATDTSGTDFPEWLGGFEPESAAEAYLATAAELLPILERHDVWFFAIANEPPLADDDDLDRADFATFVELVVDGMDAIAPDLPVGFTFAGGDPFIDDPAIDRLVEAVEVYSVNHYCLDAVLTATPLEDVAEPIDRHVERAGDRPVVFQEFGCPAGELIGSSEQFQRAWLDAALTHLDQLDQVRAAFVFEFLDWSPNTYDLDYGTVEATTDSEREFLARLRDWLLTSGLVRIDGTPRPAFDLFLERAAD